MKKITIYSLSIIVIFIIYSVCMISCRKSEPSQPSNGEGPYYVATNGDDSNPGTESEPWRTIQKAAGTAAAGDTVFIKSGVYEERVVMQNSGSSGNYIVFTAFQEDTVTIDGSNITLPAGWGGLFDISGASYITVTGLRITNAGPDDNNVGILVDNSSYISLQNNYTYNTTGSGIGVWDSDNISVIGNEVELACNDGEQECITIATTDVFEVVSNHIHHGGPGTIGGEGIDAKDGSSNGLIHDNNVHHLNRLGIYVEAWDKHTYNIEVYNNVIHDCTNDGLTVASEGGGLLEDVRIYNNVVYDNDLCGITISPQGYAATHPMRDIYIINNTFFSNGSGSWGGGILNENPEAGNVVVRNNICSDNLSFQIAIENATIDSMTVDHNLIDGFQGYAGEIYGSDSIVGDPLFVNQAGEDFHLQGGSPAIDNGSSLDAPNFDFDDNSRPFGSEFDIGAYEYVGKK
jgi:parallel beta-helix repeat protein